jgi:PAS domain-containing protein
VASLASLALNPILGSRSPFAFYYVAVLVTAFSCGLGPSVLALVLGSWSALVVFSHGGGSEAVWLASTPVGLGLYYLVGLAAIAVSEGHRRVQRRLEQEVAERRRAERELRESEERHRVTLGGERL